PEPDVDIAATLAACMARKEAKRKTKLATVTPNDAAETVKKSLQTPSIARFSKNL
ncbi:hypothetical protein HDU98_007259, partial [Podochytrium sp. JEL0797]